MFEFGHKISCFRICVHLRLSAVPQVKKFYAGSSAARSGCGRAMTSAMMSLPPKRSTVALPVAIAAALVHRDRTVVAWTGDGGFAMTMAELETAARKPG